MTYTPPVADMMFVLDQLGGQDMPDNATREAILTEAAKLARDVLAPLNRTGDTKGCRLDNGAVVTAPGFRDAYAQYRDAGWNGLPFTPDYGGQGLPLALSFAVQEMWQGANMAFGLCPMLNQAAVEAIEAHGTKEQKDLYLAKLISGEWTGTMNLTEPQAGSDLAAITAKAVRQADGIYRLTGQKIFITYGEHDFTPNIIHMVLARTPDAPEGVKGLSLFIVPKILPDGERNDVACAGIEHKLGIHASPTCTMAYGERGGAVAWMIGKEHEGIKCMFTMMNNARLSVGLQGVALAEHAYQHALAYARQRVQGVRGGKRVPIVEHADVKRMLLDMKARVEAGRAFTYEAAAALDRARAGDTDALAKAGLLTPVVKAWCTDMAVTVASTGVQIHGGMGYIEETGAAQFYRDARILPIYEGTNGIQAQDLVFRKIIYDNGAAAEAFLKSLEQSPVKSFVSPLRKATAWILERGKAGENDTVAAASVPYLDAFGATAAGAALMRGLDSGGDAAFLRGKRQTAAFYLNHILPQAAFRLKTIGRDDSGAGADITLL